MTLRRFTVFAIAALMTATLTAQSATQSTQSQQEKDQDFLKGAYLPGEPGLTAPVVLKHVYPKYTPDAMRAKIEGRVVVQIVVMPDGTVARARVTESLDSVLGLDAEAIAAARSWLFKPAQLAQKAVPAAVSVVLEFRLH